jgi:NADH-quinone oxidoreductase subunit L
LPTIGALVLIAGKRKLPGEATGWIASLAVGAPFALLLKWLLGHPMPPGGFLWQAPFAWIEAGSLSISPAFLLDPLSALLALVVTGVGFLIHLYSIGYMRRDPSPHRYFGYLNLFIAFMLVLVLSENLLVLFVGWEGVGLASYLLIGFWHQDPDKAKAGMKAFVVNRIGDAGFIAALAWLIADFGTLSIRELLIASNNVMKDSWTVTAITLLLLLGVAGKSAQFPLYVWLPDAMAGPTPVSALIHAATMVTAGIYLVARLSFLFALAPVTMGLLGLLGGATLLWAALLACRQHDCKKILAYSTVSQLGYMALALGAGAWGAALFHLTTHAFFKATLFLAAGSLIHALHGEQDIRKMGGLGSHLPMTGIAFGIGALALAGIPPLSGFFSKDAILLAAYHRPGTIPRAAWVLALLGIPLTAFYITRAYLLIFQGASRMEPGTPLPAGRHGVPHESPPSMVFPMGLLALASILGGVLGLPHGFGAKAHFLTDALSPVLAPLSLSAPSEEGGGMIMTLSLTLAIAGGVTALLLYPLRPPWKWKGKAPMERRFKDLLRADPLNAFCERMLSPLCKGGAVLLWAVADRLLIDGLVDGTAEGGGYLGGRLRSLQNGRFTQYALLLFGGTVAILLLLLLIV